MIQHFEILIDVLSALQEDVGTGDISSALLANDKIIITEISSREPMLVCGRPWIDAVFHTINNTIKINWYVNEGEWLKKPHILCQITGKAQDILTAERTALNFLQTLSGTATKTYNYVQALQGISTKLLDTRKTLPKLRKAQKYAVACAGGYNHRFGLYDAYLLKENHIKTYGSISKAITAARIAQPHVFLEIEVETLTELSEALESKPDRILLDNFNLDLLQQAIAIRNTANFYCPLEASGGINIETIKAIAATGVDFISIGELTKSLQPIDLTLLIKKVL